MFYLTLLGILLIVVSIVIIQELYNRDFWTAITFFFCISFILGYILLHTTLLQFNGLYHSKEHQQKFETQLSEITNEYLIVVKEYKIHKKEMLDVQIGSKDYEVEYITKGKNTEINRILYKDKICYEENKLKRSCFK